MTARARAGIFQRLLGWVVGVADSTRTEAAEQSEEPLVKLPHLVVALASLAGKKNGGFQVMIERMSSQHLNCRSRELLEEGQEYELAVLLQGIGPVKIPVLVEWVLLSSYGHSAGLKVLGGQETREQLSRYLELVVQRKRG